MCCGGWVCCCTSALRWQCIRVVRVCCVSCIYVIPGVCVCVCLLPWCPVMILGVKVSVYRGQTGTFGAVNRILSQAEDTMRYHQSTVNKTKTKINRIQPVCNWCSTPIKSEFVNIQKLVVNQI